MFCVKCGNTLPDDANFCSVCGNKLKTKEDVFCPNCGNKLVSGASFCNSCGTKIEKNINNTHENSENRQSVQEIEFNYKRGLECLQGCVYENAFTYFRNAAEQGHVKSQYKLAQMYQEGIGISESKKHAAKWYTMAAEQGSEEAQYKIALMDMGETGKEGAERYFKTKLKWLELLAKQGCEEAMYHLAILLESTEKCNDVEYLRHFGEMYKDVTQNYNRARELYEEIIARNNRAKELQKKMIVQQPLNPVPYLELSLDFYDVFGQAAARIVSMEFRTKIEKINVINDKGGLADAIADFYTKIMPQNISTLKDELKKFYIYTVSENFEKKLQGALTYAQLKEGEIPLIIIDETVRGNAKNGILFTTYALYVKNTIGKPKKIVYQDVKSVDSVKDGRFYYQILINGNQIGYLTSYEDNAMRLRDFFDGIIFSLKHLQKLGG